MIHSSDATSYSMIRALAGFYQPGISRVKSANGQDFIVRPKFRFMNPNKLPFRGGAMQVGVQPGFGIRTDYTVNPTPPPTSFFNTALTFFKYCSCGPFSGPAACASVLANVFESTVSQEDADDMAEYAASLIGCLLVPGPCCCPPWVVADLVWFLEDIAFTDGVTFPTYTIDNTNQVFTSHVEGVANLPGTRVGTGSGVEFQSSGMCAPTTDYDITFHISYVITATGGAPMSAAIALFWEGGSFGTIDEHDFSAPGSGSYTVTVTAQQWNANGPVRIVTIGHSGLDIAPPPLDPVADGTMAMNTTISITPLQPPEESRPAPQACTIIDSVPVPFHYADRPANDDFDNAQVISGLSGTANGSNVNASVEIGEPNFSQTIGASFCKTVWYAWTAVNTAPVTFDTFGSDFDTVLAAYTGSSVDALTQVAINDDAGPGSQSQITFNAQSGTTYYLQVSGFTAASGNIVLNWSP